MSIYYLLVLTGLMVEIVACFILSIAAIGPEHVANWANRLSLFQRDLDERKDEAPFFSLRSLVTKTIGVLGIVLGFVLAQVIAVKFLGRETSGIFSFFMAGLVGTVLYLGLLSFLGICVSALDKLETRTRERSSIIIGFLLLLVGFILQFFGTLGQVLSK